MRAKKFLRKQAEAEKQNILEAGNINVYDEWYEQNKTPEPKRNFFARYSKWLISATGALAAALILVCVFVFYPKSPPPVVYLEQNFVVSDSTIEELDKDMKEFEFDVDASIYSIKIKKTTDSVSGDVIYYQVRVDQLDSLVKFEFVAVCNPNYEYDNFNLTDDFINADLPNYPVTYRQIISSSEYDLPQINAKAQIQKGSEFIYITDYNELMLDEEGSLLKIIQEMFI